MPAISVEEHGKLEGNSRAKPALAVSAAKQPGVRFRERFDFVPAVQLADDYVPDHRGGALRVLLQLHRSMFDIGQRRAAMPGGPRRYAADTSHR